MLVTGDTLMLKVTKSAGGVHLDTLPRVCELPPGYTGYTFFRITFRAIFASLQCCDTVGWVTGRASSM